MKSTFLFIFTFTLLLSLSLLAGTVHPLTASGSKYDTYLIYESDVKSVTVLVDYEEVQTDCHGLDYLYEVKKLTENRFIVSKKLLLKPFYLCKADFFKLQQKGIRIEIPTVKGLVGYSVHAEVIVPAESSVNVQLERN